MNPRISQILEEPIIFCSTQACESKAPREVNIAGKIWLTMDSAEDTAPLVSETGKVKGKIFSKSIRNLTAKELLKFETDSFCTLTDFCEKFSNSPNFFLELVDPAFGSTNYVSNDVDNYEIVEKITKQIPDGSQAWLCHSDLEFLGKIRQRNSKISLVHRAKLSSLPKGLESHAKSLSEAGVNALCLKKDEYSVGIVTQLHRFGVCCFAWGANLMREGIELFDMGIDGIYGNNPEILFAAQDEIYLK